MIVYNKFLKYYVYIGKYSTYNKFMYIIINLCILYYTVRENFTEFYIE